MGLLPAEPYPHLKGFFHVEFIFLQDFPKKVATVTVQSPSAEAGSAGTLFEYG